jgi:hypothetical protein
VVVLENLKLGEIYDGFALRVIGPVHQLVLMAWKKPEQRPGG